MIPPLVLRIYADSSGVKKGVAQANAQVSGLRASVIKNASLIKTGLVAGVVVGLGLSVKAASDLNEAMNKSNVVFGKSAAVVKDFADESAKSFGISQAAAYDAAASFGAMFDSAGLMESEAARMSVTMSKLAADMGSFNNVPVVEMLEKLRGGLAGEAEPLRRFGVFISEARVETEAFAMGMEQVNGKFTDAQKIQARYNIILKDTKKQQGDFGRTLGESLPNQIKVFVAQLTDLAAKIGKVILPALVKFLGLLNAIIAPLVKIAEILGTDSWDRFGAKLEEAGLTTADATEKIKDMQDAMEGSNASGRQLGGAMAAVERQTIKAEEAARSWASRQAFAQHAMTQTTEALQRFSGFLGMTREEQKKWAADLMAGFDGIKGALDSLADKAKVTAKQVIKAFRDQAKNLRDYNANLQEVSSRNIPGAVLDQLLAMGLEGSNILAALAGATDKEFRKIVKSMQMVPKEGDAVSRTLRNIQDQVNALAGTYTIHIDVTGGEGVNAVGLTLGQRARGGPVNARTPYIVGERGPELFIPKASGDIVPNGAGVPAGGGRLRVSIDRRRWVNEADYEVAYGGA